MLVRSSPFREWVAVYYDPKRTSEEKLVKVLRERRCSGARVDREESQPLTVMNPCVGPGDVVQLRLGAKKKSEIEKVELPEGWKLIGKPGGYADPDGVTYFTVQLPAAAKSGKRKLLLHPAEGKALEASVEVVRKVGA